MFAPIIEFILSHWKAVGISAIILAVTVYVGFLKLELKHDNTRLSEDQQTISNLKDSIQLQDASITQMQKYADQKQAEIASATTLAEKMQDTVDAQAKEIELRKTAIEGTINTLSDCKGELDRIKNYMISAEQEFKNGRQNE